MNNTKNKEIAINKIKEIVKEGLEVMIFNPSDEGFAIPSYVTFDTYDRGFPLTHVEPITPNNVEDIIVSLGWECRIEDCESDDWGEVWLVFTKGNKEFIFNYNGYNFTMKIYGMIERGDES